MKTEYRYQMYCPVCLTTTYAQPYEDIDFKCIQCKNIFDAESAMVIDLIEMEYYRASYEGAKRAGLIDAMKCEKFDHERDGFGFCIRCGMAPLGSR